MPDWLAHVLFAYVLCRVLGLKFKGFDKENRAVVMIGSLMPDLVKFGTIFYWIGFNVYDYISPFHTPVGVLLSAALVSLFFYDAFSTFLFLTLGSATHFLLDLLLRKLSNGLLLFFPFSWNRYQLGLIGTDNYSLALIFLILAVLISKMTDREDI